MAGRAGTWWLQGVLRNEAMIGWQSSPEAMPQLSGHTDLSGHSLTLWKGLRQSAVCGLPRAPAQGQCRHEFPGDKDRSTASHQAVLQVHEITLG